MRKSVFIKFGSLLIGTVLYLSCQNTTQEPQKDTTPASEQLDATSERKKANNPPPTPAGQYGEKLVQSEPINELILQTLTNGFWVAEGAYVSDEPDASNEIEGQWWRFYADNSFESGIGQESIRIGKWAYHHDMKLLQLDFHEGKDQEYTIKMVGEIMVFVSTKTFENRNLQIKLRRKRENPT